MSRTRKIKFDPETDNEEDLMRQNVAHRREMEDALLKGHVERAADAWDKSERLVDRLEEVRARKGQKANRKGENGPLHGQDTEIGHLTRGEIVIPLSAQTPRVMRALQEVMGETLSRYVVGSGQEARNPSSGLPAYYGSLSSGPGAGFQGEVNQVAGQSGLPQHFEFGQTSSKSGQPVEDGAVFSGRPSFNLFNPVHPDMAGLPQSNNSPKMMQVVNGTSNMAPQTISEREIYEWLEQATFGEVERKIQEMKREAVEIYDGVTDISPWSESNLRRAIRGLEGLKVAVDAIAASASRSKNRKLKGISVVADGLSILLSDLISKLKRELQRR